MHNFYSDTGIVVDGVAVTSATLRYPTLTGFNTAALTLTSIVGGTKLTAPASPALPQGFGELTYTTSAGTFVQDVAIGSTCVGKPAEHITTAAVTPVVGVTAVDLEVYPDGSVHGLNGDGTTFLVQAAPVAPVVPPTPCPSVRIASGGFLFHPADVQDPAATVQIEDCDGVAIGKGYPTAGVGHTVELWSCDTVPVLLGYAANLSSCAPPCPCASTSASTTAGPAGNDGASAYQLAVNGGFVGTQAQWLASLQGANGQSAYQAAVAGGFVGTQAQWIASLQGTNGQSAYQIAVANGFVGSQAAWLASLQGQPAPVTPGVLTATSYNPSTGQLTAATIDGIAYTYTYDASGRLATVSFNATTLTYTYNPDGSINTVM